MRPELEEGEKQALKGAGYTKNLFYLMTCIATFNCIIRSDFNFAFGLMGYYMIKTVNIKKIERTAFTVSKTRRMARQYTILFKLLLLISFPPAALINSQKSSILEKVVTNQESKLQKVILYILRLRFDFLISIHPNHTFPPSTFTLPQ